MNTWFRRQHGSTTPVSNTIPTSVNKKKKKKKIYIYIYKSNKHRNPIRTDETQEPNKLRRRHKDPDDKHANTTIRKTTHTQNRITPFKQEDLLRRNSREQIHQCYFIIDMYKDTSPHLINTRENGQATTRLRTRIEDQSPQKTTAPDANPRTNPRWWRKKIERNANPGGGILHQ
mgnify:CR=1 FL=1